MIDDGYRSKIAETARALGVSPVDMATVISYETGGTFDPSQRGPTTRWGQHRGLIQFGEPQARQYGVDWNNPIDSQLGADGAIVRYALDRGFKPGGSLMDLYSTINAGAPGLENRSDTAAGGMPGTVRDKVENQFAPHRAKAEQMMGVQVADAGGFTLEQVEAEIARRQAAAAPQQPAQGGFTLEQVEAEIARRQAAAQPQPEAPAPQMNLQPWGAGHPRAPDPATLPQTPPPSGDAPTMASAATQMVNDLNAGFQGVNPVGVAQSRPIGEVMRGPDGEIVSVRIDGADEDPSQFTPDKFATQRDPKTGAELLYVKTPENDASVAESAGRVLGYAIPNSLPTGRPAPAPKPAPGAAAEAIGVTPSLGMTGKIGAMLAGAGESNIVTAGPITRDAQRAAGEMGEAAGRIADTAGAGSTRIDGGNAIRSGGTNFTENFDAKSGRLYDAVSNAIPRGKPVTVTNTLRHLGDVLSVFENTPNIAKAVGNTNFKGWAQDILANDGKLTYQQLKELRSAVGAAQKSINDPLAKTTAGARLKTLYGALTEDMAAAAKANGAEKLWKRADQFYKAGQNRIKNALDIVFKADAPEKAFDSVVALGAARGARANLGKLNAIKKSMSPDEWGEFVGTVIRRMGAPNPGGAEVLEEGAFSAAKFLTEWNKLDPAARSVMFRGKGLPKTLAPALDQLAEVSSAAKSAGTEINRSRSGAVGQAFAMGAATIAAPQVVIPAAVLGHLGARALTMPGVVRALASYGKTGNPGALRRLAQGKGAESVEAMNLLRQLEQAQSASPEAP